VKSAVKRVKAENSQVVLLRVGIDTGSGGMLGPIFADGSFEFIPIDADRDCLRRTYANTQGRHGRKLIEYFPNRLKDRMKDSFMHFDPEFDTFTYGDPTSPKQSLANLGRGDLLVFYAGLQGCGDCRTSAGLYIVGYFVVEHAGKYNDLKREGVLKPFSKNWHILNEHKEDRFQRLILVKGGKGSRLLGKAVKISADEKAIDRGGHPVFVLDRKMQRHFGNFTELNAIQRSTPRWVKPEFCDRAVVFAMALR
jgi:putative DNA base modification enzyme with NMAD domain